MRLRRPKRPPSCREKPRRKTAASSATFCALRVTRPKALQLIRQPLKACHHEKWQERVGGREGAREPGGGAKPQPQVYARFLARHNVDPKRAAIFEDLARNLQVPHALGMITVLVVPKGAGVVLREDWELAGRDEPHVDHVTDDLAEFLREVGQSDQNA